MASRYWVGGGSSTNWNATGNTNWSATDGGANNAAVPAAGDDVFFKGAANCVVNVATANLKSLDMTGYSGALSGTMTLTVQGSAGLTSVVVLGGTITGFTGQLFLAPGTGTSNLNVTSNGRGVVVLSIGSNGTGIIALQDNFTLADSVTAGVTLFGNGLNLNGKTLAGANATVGRALIQGTPAGAAKTITVNGGTFANADFVDVNLSVATDLSAITGGSGDCGGNSNITFTPATTQTATGTASFTWSTHGWTSRVPLAQDNAVIPNAFIAGRVITLDMPRLGRNFDMTGCTGSPQLSFNLTNHAIFGDLILASGVTTVNISRGFVFAGRRNATLSGNSSNTSCILTVNTLPTFTVSLGSNLVNTRALVISSGGFDGNDFNLTTGVVNASPTVTSPVLMGNGVWTLTGTAGVWTANAAATLSAEGSTINITDATVTGKTFTGGAKTYNILQISGDRVTIAGNNTFAEFRDTNLNNHTILFTVGSTQTIGNFNVEGWPPGIITLDSTTTGTFTLVKSGGGVVASDYLDIQHCVATPGSTWYAGTHSVNDQAVATAGSGWIFTDAPGGTTTVVMDAALIGGGTLAAAATRRALAAGALSGGGSLAASVKLVRPIAVPMTGAGTLTASTRIVKRAAASMTGAGALTAAAIRRTVTAAALTGAGTLVATIAGSGSLGMAFTGAGSLSGTMRRAQWLSADLSGAGQVSWALDRAGALTVALEGLGTLAAVIAGGKTEAAAAFSGAGVLIGSLVRTQEAAVFFTASGSMGVRIEDGRLLVPVERPGMGIEYGYMDRDNFVRNMVTIKW